MRPQRPQNRAWYVHCDSSGVTGSSSRSTTSSSIAPSPRRKSNSADSCHRSAARQASAARGSALLTAGLCSPAHMRGASRPARCAARSRTCARQRWRVRAAEGSCRSARGVALTFASSESRDVFSASAARRLCRPRCGRMCAACSADGHRTARQQRARAARAHARVFAKPRACDSHVCGWKHATLLASSSSETSAVSRAQ